MRLKYVLLFLLGIMIFPVSAQDKNVDKSNFHARILFRIGKGDLDLDFMNNRAVMNSFIDKLNVILADSNYVVDELKIVGAASPDGMTEKHNIELAQARAEAMKNYICSKVNISTSLIKLENKGENWEAVRAMVVASGMPYKEEVLQIIDRVADRNQCKNKLIFLHNSVPYNYMKKNFFPFLRSGMCGTSYDKVKSMIVSKSLYGADSQSSDNWSVLKEYQEVSEKPEEKVVYTSVPFLAVKTNLLYWGGITPEIKHRDMIPNLELELYAGKHISFNADVFYTYLNESKVAKNTWGVSGIGVEPRFWFCKPGQFAGLYAGVYGAYGDFDVKPENITSNGHTGDFYEGGFSSGYYQSLSSHWGIEVGGRCGYRSVSGDIYYFSDPHYYKQSSFTQSGLKLTGIRLLVTYRFGRSIKIKSDK
jgi:hypothetical protein